MMFNRYAYANNNPYKFTDPEGKSNILALNPEKNHQSILTPEQAVALKNASTFSAGVALGASMGVKTGQVTAKVGAEISYVVANGGPTGVENVFTMEAGAKLETPSAEATAQLFKVEEHGRGVLETYSSTIEGPKLDGKLKSGNVSVGREDNKITIEATLIIVKGSWTIDRSKLK